VFHGALCGYEARDFPTRFLTPERRSLRIPLDLAQAGTTVKDHFAVGEIAACYGTLLALVLLR